MVRQNELRPPTNANMEKIVNLVSDTTIAVILCTICVTCLCAIKISLCPGSQTKFNKNVVPGFPCNGTLFILASDGVMYIVPREKALVKTDMVREVHCGRIVRNCDTHGNFAYFEQDIGRGQSQQHEQYAVDNIIGNSWSVGSALSQDLTVSVSDDEAFAASPLQSPLAGEVLSSHVQMI